MWIGERDRPIFEGKTRDVWFWKKAWDSELLWMPNRIIISDKSIEKWWYEFTKRWEEKSEIIWF